jgi:predicted membrane GTPase involved in stress response
MRKLALDVVRHQLGPVIASLSQRHGDLQDLTLVCFSTW